MWKITVVLMCAAAGCVDASLVTCLDGLACPVNDRCDEVHHSCVQPDQLTVCGAAAEGADCAAGPISGGCFAGVCLPRGCGNHVIEPGEMCDDGNQISGDGCSGDCRSTEICGNGFVDPGEPCDDGDLISHDGCDSRCQVEDAGWSPIIAISPDFVQASWTAYDAARELVVAITQSGTWEWDGAQWTLHSSPLNAITMFYNPDVQRAELVASDVLNVVHLYAWTSGQWLPVDSTAGPIVNWIGSQATATYDAARHQVVLVAVETTDTGQVWTVDASGAWQEGASLPAGLDGAVAAFDPESAEVVVETTSAVEWVYDGTGWAPLPTRFGPTVSLGYDPDRGHLVLVDDDSQVMYERSHSAWAAIDTGSMPCTHDPSHGALPLYYDRTTSTIELLSSDVSAICRWDGSWSTSEPPLPFSPIGASYDPVTHGFVVVHNAHANDPASVTELWTLADLRWSRIETLASPGGGTDVHAVYSPGRAATVLYGERVDTSGNNNTDCAPHDRQADTWSFDGADWTWIASISTDAPPCTKSGATYDPDNGRVLLTTYDEVWSLGDGDHAWVRLDASPSLGQILGVAWNARTGNLMASRRPEVEVSSPLFDLRDGSWLPLEVIPTSLTSETNVFVSDQRAGGVIAIDMVAGDAWDRIGAGWVKLPPAPLQQLFAAWTAYNPVDGSVLYIGRTQGGVFATILTRTSATPFESCRAGEDLDGDGLAGCDDPDCYWMCTRCLPFTSCR